MTINQGTVRRTQACGDCRMIFEVICKHCGEEFFFSLQEIVRGWGRLTCPKCAQTREYSLADVREQAA